MSEAQHESSRAASSELDFGGYAPCATSELAKINRRPPSKGEVDSQSAHFRLALTATFSSPARAGAETTYSALCSALGRRS